VRLPQVATFPSCRFNHERPLACSSLTLLSSEGGEEERRECDKDSLALEWQLPLPGYVATG
jgi:hypothetical protein